MERRKFLKNVGIQYMAGAVEVSSLFNTFSRIADYASESTLEKEFEQKWGVNILGIMDSDDIKHLDIICSYTRDGWDQFGIQLSAMCGRNNSPITAHF